MRGNILRAIALDAFHQVVSNWVFRILGILALVPVAFTFALGFREQEILLFFGLKRWGYEGVLGFLAGMSGGSTGIEHGQVIVIAALQEVVFGFLVGNLGVLFCIAATSFFVPRMIEKGAAEVLFGKPVSRLVLFLSRYLAGLVFISALAVLCSGGMYLGLLLVSGYSEPGILCAALTLSYGFALIHSVTMLIGATTRSTVASILLSVLFFFGNGCIHNLWILKEQHSASEAEEAARNETDQEEEEEEPAQGNEGPGRFVRGLFVALDTAHFVLPKTTDAGVITKKLRKAVSRPLYQDEGSGFLIDALPAGTKRADVSPGITPIGHLLGEPRLAFQSEDGETLTWLHRRSPRDEEEVSERTGRKRLRRESSGDAARLIKEALEDPEGQEGTEGVELFQERFGAKALTAPVAASVVSWNENLVVVFRSGEWVYSLRIETSEDVSTPEGRAALLEPVSAVSGQESAMTKPDWYEDRLGLDSPWRYNIYFSIGSSLAFTALMLLLGWLRLRRLEF